MPQQSPTEPQQSPPEPQQPPSEQQQSPPEQQQPPSEQQQSPPEQPFSLTDGALAALVATGYGVPALAALLFGAGQLVRLDAAIFVAGALGLAGWIGLTVWTYRAIRRRGRAPFQVAAEVLTLLLLPAWGMAYSHDAPGTCAVPACDVGTTAFRPLAEPEVHGLIALHALTALAYVVSRRRKEALPGPAELVVHAALLVGIALHVLLVVHFGPWVAAGLLVPPLLLPCVAPVFTVVFYSAELRARLLRRGVEASAPAPLAAGDPAYRAGPPQVPLPPPPAIHRPTLWRALAATPLLLGVHAVLHAAWLGHPAAALQVFTRTCGYTLSQLPIVKLPGDCHYLCTVAARGHAWLVRPIRLGRRGGTPILVNRQLAIANAFEDLLHERWPRFGRAARQLYDRMGLPVSRYIGAAWAADVIYLAMKPLEWAFYLTLLLLDPRAPEERIDRMYR
ncbi:DUF6688 family protein [Sorangium sp. So ce363]|uniref:DUF6688 family protein n=1 Tax=Sorangium sp. So ce363 TaxID=3133304 RepID=UPI003F61A200